MNNRNKIFWSVLIVLLVIASGCITVRLVADYDEETDAQVTTLYRNMMTYMDDTANMLKVTGSDSVARATKYAEIVHEIGVLKLRATAKEKNEIQIEQVDLLLDSWKKVGELEKLKAPKEEMIIAKSGLEITLTAILKLEIAKKRS